MKLIRKIAVLLTMTLCSRPARVSPNPALTEEQVAFYRARTENGKRLTALRGVGLPDQGRI